MKKRNLLALYVMELCAGLARGSYLVCIGWSTLVVSGDVAVVGQVFIMAMLSSIFSGPFLGIIVDRYNRKYLTIFAHLGIAISLATLGLALELNSELSVFWFFITVIFVNAFRLLYQGSHDGLIHANVNSLELVHTVARFRGGHLLATAVGTLFTGIVIERLSMMDGFLFSALASLVLILAVTFVKGVNTKESTAGFIGYLQDFSGWFALLRNNQALPALIILAGVALPVGQLSNSILSSFIRDDLGFGSDIFGFVDAAWPVGGMIAAAVVSLGLRHLSASYMEYVFACLVGITTIVFSFMTAVIPLAITHATLGFSVWMCRIIIDGRILQSCTAHTVGRTKSYIDIVFSFVAIMMSFSPTVIKLPSTSGYFLFWGVIIMVCALMLTLKNILFHRGFKL